MAVCVMVFILLSGCAAHGQTAEDVRFVDDLSESTWQVEEETQAEGQPRERDEDASELPSAQDDPQTDSDESGGKAAIYVDVCGAVVSPGVVRMPEGSRVFEAIEKAGGLGQDADGVAIQSFLVIPNTAIDVLQSMTFITPVHADQASIDLVKGLFDTMGSSMVIEYGMMAAATAVASCGIAYAMRYILDAARGGVEMGFDPAEAVPVVCQTMIGAIGLMTKEGADPEAEIVKVCTPGGLTLKGLKEMEEAGFTSAVIRGLKASVK